MLLMMSYGCPTSYLSWTNLKMKLIYLVSSKGLSATQVSLGNGDFGIYLGVRLYIEDKKRFVASRPIGHQAPSIILIA